MTGWRPLAALALEAGELDAKGLAELVHRLEGDTRQGARQLRERLMRRLQEMEALRLRDERLRAFDAAFSAKGPIAGCDEVGRGPLAGPLVAAAVVLPPGVSLLGLDDSKRMSAKAREALFGVISQTALAWCVVFASVESIDRVGVGRANLEALCSAASSLAVEPQLVLSDYFPLPGIRVRNVPVVGGDGRSQAIAAASVVAKVVRDRYMARLDAWVPGYALGRNAGYGTSEHVQALRALGPSIVHRRSFLSFLDEGEKHEQGGNPKGPRPSLT